MSYSVASQYKPLDPKNAPGSTQQMNAHLSSILSRLEPETSSTTYRSSASSISSSARRHLAETDQLCPKAVALIGIIRPKFVPNVYMYMFPRLAEQMPNFASETYIQKMWLFVQLIPVAPIPPTEEQPIVFWLEKHTAKCSKFSPQLQNFFKGRIFHVALFIAILPKEVIEDLEKVDQLMKQWMSLSGIDESVIPANERQVASVRFQQIATGQRDTSEEGKLAIRQCVRSIIENIAMYEVHHKMAIVYSTLSVPEYMSDIVRYSLLVLAAQPEKLRKKAFDKLKKRIDVITPLTYHEFNYSTRTIQAEPNVLLFAVLKLPRDMPELTCQTKFKNALYTKEEQDDGTSTVDILHQMLCFCTPHVIDIWNTMGWRLDLHIVRKMHQLRDRKWSPSPNDLVDIILYTFYEY
ncbi:MAG: hypothetical protein ACTSUE_05055 [Promethearchaeota archaeon]